MTEPAVPFVEHEPNDPPVAGKYLEPELQEGISQDEATDGGVE